MNTTRARDARRGASLAEIAQGFAALVEGDAGTRVTGIHHDSRRVEPGDLFVARRGERSDGLLFVQQAVDRGAVAVMAEREHAPGHAPVPVLLVEDIRQAIGRAASAIYGDPTHDLEVVGITGTNGKTTTSYLARAAIDGAGMRTGVLGTLGASFSDLRFDALHTTPEADEVARVAASMRDAGATHLVMEVSSHALDQRRADAVRFRVAAFTNLTQDHLDYHGTVEAYAAAKTRLFTDLSPASSVIMIDDPFGERLARRVGKHCIRVSIDPNADADVRPVSAMTLDARGLRGDVLTPSGQTLLDAPYVGEHNLANLLLTLGIVSALGLSVDTAAAALHTSAPVPGRFERCDGEGDDIVVLVDYAHTPDALERALRAIRPLTEGRIICVFGCGGDRDRLKRPQMGAIAGRGADLALLTNDNPRSESPQAIADAVLSGIPEGTAEVVVELDRARAIRLAMDQAQPGDVVLIAGKGHETVQIVGEHQKHFDDRQEARTALAARRRRVSTPEG